MRIPAAAAPLFFILCCCQSFTEHSGPPRAGLVIIDAHSLEILGTLDGIPGGRALCAGRDGGFYVASTTGTLYRGNSYSMTLDTSFVIGPGGSAGYGSMAYIPWKKSLYVIGATGTLLEVNTTNFTVAAEVAAGGSPTYMVPSRTSDYLFVTDPLNNRVHTVNTSTNQMVRTFQLGDSPTVMACNAWGNDTLLVSTSDPVGTAYVQPWQQGSPARRVTLESASDMVQCRRSRLFFAAHPRHGQSAGRVSVIDSLFPRFSVRETLVVPGNPHHLATHGDSLWFFVLSTGDIGECNIFSFREDDGRYLLNNSLELRGYPADMIIADDRLIVLTY
jgi:DNA-binding beta-propeller fold protein YncE